MFAGASTEIGVSEEYLDVSVKRRCCLRFSLGKSNRMKLIKYITRAKILASPTLTSRTERAVHAALSINPDKLRTEFLKVIQHGSVNDKALVGYIFREATGQELHPDATKAWDGLISPMQGELTEAVKIAVYAIEGQREIDVPLSDWTTRLAGLPDNASFAKYTDESLAKLTRLSCEITYPGLSKTIARFVYPHLKNSDPSWLWHNTTRIPSRTPNSDASLRQVVEGYAAAFEFWGTAESNSLTRAVLFKGMCGLLRMIGSCSDAWAHEYGDRIMKRFGFTIEEIVKTPSLHDITTSHWRVLPRGSRILGVFGIPLERYDTDKEIRREWTIGYLARMHGTSVGRTQREEASPSDSFRVQTQQALLVDEPVDRYIAFFSVVNKFKGYLWSDPADPLAAPLDVVDTLKPGDYPDLPSYEEVERWRDKQLKLIAHAVM